MMASAGSAQNVGKGSFKPDSDVHITYEDQEKINRFARHNARLEELKEELKGKETDLRNIGDAEEELILVDSSGEDIPCLMGEVFVYQDGDRTQSMLERMKERLRGQVDALKGQCKEVQEAMSALKTQLYAKFGDNINLEPDEE
ncbi:unnamed protein product [Darwinula stevensoni]|uniref:Prefoldin subunit 4 n=1 Tax=Darwinula stevensoni TaxID=69355 RepID=A0A7R9A5V0_9CRUS|nr:unnamed protein product [Darwinula stevensoni]CAD7248767.1 unnamed protein product [Darwinula stevensoni]CAG0894841.1 unnamed protein product [Darwinula stevensoni]CAG0895193.1 unnamed protein product [Darwinula stevensoni]